MKTVLSIAEAPRPHWVGDGFHVQSLFSYATHGEVLSPFLLLDYGAPREFPPSSKPRGVGEHPHRGFETVTIVYEGEVSHRDSTGRGGTIGPGDVQWMTAGAGILHEEFNSEAFTRRGGRMRMVQLWVNLPARHKGTPAGYQAIPAADIPKVDLPGGAGWLRIIAGDFGGARGPARTFSPMQVWDAGLGPGGAADFPIPAGWSTALVVLEGEVEVEGRRAGPGQLVVLDPGGSGAAVRSDPGGAFLLLAGEPLREPIAGYGPFVMNTREEIVQALRDYEEGRFGGIPG